MILYLPVIHRGYERLIARYASGTHLLILGKTFGDRYRIIRKGIRGIDPSHARAYVQAVFPDMRVSVIEFEELGERIRDKSVILPDEDLMHELVSDFHMQELAKQVHYERTFLRWDRKQANARVPAALQGVEHIDHLARLYLQVARQVGERSPDWWRQVGALAVRGPTVITSYNHHLPSEYSLYAYGDPRDSYRRKQRLDLSTAVHAEAGLIAKAARDGIALAGADIYVSTFPCPACARLIASAGFKRLFFVEGYSTLAGAEVLRAAGLEIFAIDLEPDAQMTIEELSAEIESLRSRPGTAGS